MKILVVEDNEDSRILLTKQLRAYGHEVTAAADGAEALEQALAQPPDIIVSDIMMPEMDGYQLCQQCKQNDKLRGIPFVFYTATYTREEDEKFALNLGADALVSKPTELDTFVQMLSEIVEKAASGLQPSAKVAPIEPSAFLAEHDKRIFAKLGDKVAQLEAEITKRKQAEERLEHLNRVLNAIRGVNQLIVREKDHDRLIKEACDNLVKTRGFHNAWIAILDESGGLVTYAEAGLGEDFLPVVEQLKRGELVTCGRQALRQVGVVVTKDPLSTCGDCPLAKKFQGEGALTIRLEHDERVYGLLVTSVPAKFATDEEEQSLLQEVAGDIAFALYDMKLGEERKRAEEKLRESEEKWRSLVENAPNIIMIVDSSGVIQFINRTVAGMYIQDVIGKSHYDFIQPEYHDVARKTIMGVLETGESGSYMIAGVGPHGEMAWYETQVGSIRHEGQPMLAMLVTADITGRKQAEEKAREVEVMKELDQLRKGLMANVSHELRTPLASIKGFISTLLRTDVKWGEEEQRDFLETIDHETNRLIHLINDLLDMSRIEAGGLKLDKRDYQIAEVMDSISSSLASLTERHRLKVIAPPELPPVFVDQMRIGQVLTNLVENAVKHSGEGGEITIEAQLAGEHINVSVTDRGEGIAPELLGRVFDRFYQAESIVTGKKSGTGLGLSICRGIIESHGGKIWAESQPGEGSKFSFSLPVGKGEGDGT